MADREEIQLAITTDTAGTKAATAALEGVKTAATAAGAAFRTYDDRFHDAIDEVWAAASVKTTGALGNVKTAATAAGTAFRTYDDRFHEAIDEVWAAGSVKTTGALGNVKTAATAAGAAQSHATAVFNVATASTAAYATAAGHAATATARMNTATQTFVVSANNAGNVATVNKNKMAGFGQSALQSGRVIQDFAQGGIPGILNNIEGLTQALGGGPGLAGVLTIAGVAAFVFRPQIDALLKSLNGETVAQFTSEIQKLETRLKTLAEKPVKVAVDFTETEIQSRRLKTIQDSQGTADKLIGTQTEDEQAAGKRVSEILTTPEGRDALRQAQSDFVDRRGEEAGAPFAAQIERAKRNFPGAATWQVEEREKVIAGIKAERDNAIQTARDQARNQFNLTAKQAQGGQGGTQQAAQAVLGNRIGGLIGDEVAGAKEALAQEQEIDAALDAHEAAIDARAAAGKQRRAREKKARDKETAELNAQGKHNEELAKAGFAQDKADDDETKNTARKRYDAAKQKFESRLSKFATGGAFGALEDPITQSLMMSRRQGLSDKQADDAATERGAMEIVNSGRYRTRTGAIRSDVNLDDAREVSKRLVAQQRDKLDAVIGPSMVAATEESTEALAALKLEVRNLAQKLANGVKAGLILK